MPDLSAYIDFDLELSFQDDNQIILTDTSNYPDGVEEGIIGIVSITQPDGITVAGDWGNPDVVWSETELTQAEKELRLTSQGTPQCGNYTVVYQVDHPDYTPTTLSRTFILNISLPEGNIVDQFDVFTPELSLVDETEYDISGFTTDSTVRDWEVAVGSVTVITGSTATLDLEYLGNYYDAEYEVTFDSVTTLSHDTYAYLTVIYAVTFHGEFTADTPPPVNDLVHCLTELWERLNAETDANCCTTLEIKYGKAERRLSHLLNILRVGETDGAVELLEEFINLTDCEDAVNRNNPILPYDLSGLTAGDSYYNFFLPSDLTEVEIAFLNGKIIKAIDMDGIGRVFTVGLDSDTPASGTFIVVNATPKKFKYGGTMFTGAWLRIKYTDL